MILKKQRFVAIDKNIVVNARVIDVLVDRETGVEYMMTSDGHVTVLVDPEGKPLRYNGKFDEDSEN